jgi:hypothetical protein
LELERPDRFGQYHDVMLRLHTPLLETLIDNDIVSRNAAELRILQQHMSEYIREPHDLGYTYLNYATSQGLSTIATTNQISVLVVVNNFFMETLLRRNLLNEMIDGLLAQGWLKAGDLRFHFLGRTDTLPVTWNDVIQSVHFLGHTLQPPINQFFKIVYPFKAIEKPLSLAISRA